LPRDAGICCWGDVDVNFKPVEFRPQSRLVVLSGQLNEEGANGAHFFQLEDARFGLVRSIPSAAADASVAEPTPSPAASGRPAPSDK